MHAMRRLASIASINNCMPRKCCSAHRCARIDCLKCAKRYARHVARAFLRESTGRTYSIILDANIRSLDHFAEWRVAMRNALHHRKKGSRWWHDISIRLWLSSDGRVRGLIALASITENEFLIALGLRWRTTLHPLSAEALPDALFQVVRPGSIMMVDGDHARYQHRQMTVRPRDPHSRRKLPSYVKLPDPFEEPMPIIV